ncbi:MAG TPA: MFS transporter [Desulfobacteraceae bacterium]|nr:MFS transporter [Desulfobacteraceae bacterium]HPJ69102.1 MFS transporter [Desulfobacteraceae bacterium]HPQ29096.1 MFS transporter [Desulfobacteraceae bacterium]
MSRRWLIFIVTSSNFFLSQFYRVSNAVIAQDLLVDFSIDTKGLGLISASFFYAFAVTQIPISILLDRIGPRRMITALSLVGVAGAFVFAGAGSLYSGIAGRILLGIGMACNLMGTLKLLTMWFDPLRFATLTGIVFSIGTSGNMAATTPFVLLVQLMGWRWSYCLIAVINLIIVVIIYIVVRDRPQLEYTASSFNEPDAGLRRSFSDLKSILKKRDFWIISFGTFVSYGVFSSLQGLWAGPYLIEVMGLSAINTGNIIFLMNIGMVAGGPAWGLLSDRLFNRRKTSIFLGLIVMTIILLCLALVPIGISLLILASLFLSLGIFRASGLLMYTHIKELAPLEMSGTAMTGINFFTMMGSAVFLHGLGIFMQYLYPEASRGPDAFWAAFLICSLCLACASILYFFTGDSENKSEK